MNKIVAIDGPAGSGKGTITKIIAEKLNLVYIDTGATYRCIALAAIRNNILLNEKEKLIELTKKININFDSNGRTFLDNEDVSEKIRSNEVTSIVSQISSIPEIREIMVDLQRKMANNKDVIMEGRDITTVVLPNANYKFYLDATSEERAKRRFLQNKEMGINIPLEEIKKAIEERDYNDMHKPVGSLMRTDDQIYIDTTNMTIDEVVDKITSYINK